MQMLSLFIMLLALLAIGAPGCSERTYPQQTPDDVLTSARAMVENGDAHLLTTLVYADSEQMRALLNRLGRVLARLDDLAGEVQRAFPDETAALIDEATAAAERGEAGSVLGRAGRSSKQRRGRNDPRAMFDAVMKEVVTDPYGSIERSEQRVSTVLIDDETAAVLWDGRAAFGGIGLLLKQDSDGKWYVLLPTSLPYVSRVVPQTEIEFAILAYLFEAMEKVLAEVSREVKAKRIRSLPELAEETAERIFIPGMMMVIAYSKAIEERDKPDN